MYKTSKETQKLQLKIAKLLHNLSYEKWEAILMEHEVELKKAFPDEWHDFEMDKSCNVYLGDPAFDFCEFTDILEVLKEIS